MLAALCQTLFMNTRYLQPTMNKTSIKAAFLDWWEDTYPHLSAPSDDLITTHVEFSAYLLNLLEVLSPILNHEQR